MVQKSLFNSKSEYSKSRISYGGDTRGKRKAFRPLDHKRPLHITLKSSHAKGRMSLLARKLQVAAIIESKAQMYQVKVHRFENMGNHIHMLVSFKRREMIQKFMRVIAGLIARVATNARRGKAFGKRFWDFIAHTRIVTSRRDFASLMHYFNKNEVERDSGGPMRSAMELYEDITREARRRNVSRDLVTRERLARALAAAVGNISTIYSDEG